MRRYGIGAAGVTWIGGSCGSFGHHHEVGGLGIDAFGVCLGRVGCNGIDPSTLDV